MKFRLFSLAAILAVLFALAPSAGATTLPIEDPPIDVGTTAEAFRCANGRPIVGPRCEGTDVCLGTEYVNAGTCRIRCRTVVGTITENGRYATCTKKADTFETIEPGQN